MAGKRGCLYALAAVLPITVDAAAGEGWLYGTAATAMVTLQSMAAGCLMTHYLAEQELQELCLSVQKPPTAEHQQLWLLPRLHQNVCTYRPRRVLWNEDPAGKGAYSILDQ